jgi:hypothetical protein
MMYFTYDGREYRTNADVSIVEGKDESPPISAIRRRQLADEAAKPCWCHSPEYQATVKRIGMKLACRCDKGCNCDD